MIFTKVVFLQKTDNVRQSYSDLLKTHHREWQFTIHDSTSHGFSKTDYLRIDKTFLVEEYEETGASCVTRAIHLICHLLRRLLPRGPGDQRLPDLQAERLAERRRHGVADLAVLVPDGAGELKVVAEALAARVLADTQQPVLLGVQHLPLLAEGLGVGDGGLEDAVPGHAPVHPGPVVVPVRGVGQGPGDDVALLLVVGVAGLEAPLGGGGAVADA